MKTKLFSTLLILLVLNGCAGGTIEPTVVTKIEYVKQPIPTLPKKPTPEPYKIIQMEVQRVDYFALTKYDASIMASNWISYQKWAESNSKILRKLKY